MHQDEFNLFIYSNWKLKDIYIPRRLNRPLITEAQEDVRSLRIYTLIWITSQLYTKHLFSIKQPFRSCYCPSPSISSFHAPFLPWEDAGLFHLLSAPTLPWKRASFSSPSSVTKYSFQSQRQDRLCTTSIFFQCLDKSGGKCCLHIFFPQCYSCTFCVIYFSWTYPCSKRDLFPPFSTIAFKKNCIIWSDF